MSWIHRGPRVSAAQVQLVTDAAPDDSPQALRGLVGQAVTFLNANSGTLPAAAVVNARHLTDTMSRVVEAAATARLNIHDLIALSATLNDYLPTTLQTYLKVDPALRDVPRASGLTPTVSLMRQLAALQTSTDAMLTAIATQDADALMTQGSFLSTKFARSDLDL